MTDAPDSISLLTPYATGRPQRGVVGSSRYAQKLRQELIQASKDPDSRTLMIRGEPGLGKDNLAALVHFGSSRRRKLLVRLQPADLRAKVATLLDAVEDNTLLVIGVDQLDPELQHLLAEMAEGHRPGFSGRIIFTSETCVPELDAISQLIRVPPLRVRRADLGEWLRYQLRLQCPGLGWDETPALPETVVRQLQNHDFPDNLRELESLVGRALRQARRQNQNQPPPVLAEEVFWTDQKKERSRFDIWRWKPQLREWMRAPKLWNGLLFGLVSWLFVGVNLALWLGPQTRSENPALNLFWAWWWPLILLSYPLVGRLWCAVCPFMVWGRIVQSITPWRPRAWPHGETDRWASPLMAAGFAAILIWEEVWNLENTAWLSSCLLLLITAGAAIGSLLFEKRFWCRYLCPVGGMNGLFAKLSILELRAESGTCSGSCTSFACFKGGPADGEGMETNGCPLGSHPAHLSDNRNCVLCMTCTQACPNRSVQLRLRPPAADLQRNMHAPGGERGLILVLAGGVTLHHWQRLLGWLPLAPDSLQSGPLLARLSIAVLALALPAALGLWLERKWLYSALPLLWALLLARHLPVGMLEGGTLLPAGWPSWSADPHVFGFFQTVLIAIGWIGAVVLIRRLIVPERFNRMLGSMVMMVLSFAGRWLVSL